jgi:beta-glucanase (GH16 family)
MHKLPLAKRSIALACVLAGVVAGAVPVSAGAQVSPTDCGPQIAKSSGGYWMCTFADDFNGGTLDRSNWTVMRTATSGFSHARECYVDDPSTVSVGNGLLRLTARKLATPQPCGRLFTSPYQSGMVITADSFAQAYGRFEARIKFSRGKGHHSAWWMWPETKTYGKQSGEIDIAEHYGAYPDIVSPFVHIKDLLGLEHGDGAYCRMDDPDGQYHSYAVEWLPLGQLVFSYDGVACMTFDQWNPGAPLTYPQPFDQPFFLNLTEALGWYPNGVSASTPFPATMSVEYVRAWM